jgi:hypothetical protein
MRLYPLPNLIGLSVIGVQETHAMRLYAKAKQEKVGGSPTPSRQGNRNILTPRAVYQVLTVTLLVAISTGNLLYMTLLECEWRY